MSARVAAICSLRLFHTLTGGAEECFWVVTGDGTEDRESLWWFTSPLGLKSGEWSAEGGEVDLEDVAEVGIRGSTPAGAGGDGLGGLDGDGLEREAEAVEGAWAIEDVPWEEERERGC